MPVRCQPTAMAASVNDVVLAAGPGPCTGCCTKRGAVDRLAVAVPVAGRRAAAPDQLGNRVRPTLVALPSTATQPSRLRQIAATTRAHKLSATGSPAAALLGPVFRAATALGGHRWYMSHQRRLRTLVSNCVAPIDRSPSPAPR